MGGFSFAPTGTQTMSQREVDQFLADARRAPKNKNPRVLGINQIEMIRLKNNGYPKHMYHATLEARMVTKEEEEQAARDMGYSDRYIHRHYPKVLFRRNMDTRFEPKFDVATGQQVGAAWVEERGARDDKQEKELRSMKPKKGQSAWFESMADLEKSAPIEDGPDEDPAVTIARLQGQLSVALGDPKTK